jgi:hypothetical protein
MNGSRTKIAFVIFFLILAGLAGCGGGNDSSPQTLPDIAGTYAVWQTYGEAEEAERSFVLIEQQNTALTFRDELSNDKIAEGSITSDGHVTISWIGENQEIWQGQASHITTTTLANLPDNWTIEGIVNATDPNGLKSWWAERMEPQWFLLGSAGLADAPGNGHQQIIDAGTVPYAAAERKPIGNEKTTPTTTPEGDVIECRSQAFSERIVSQLGDGTLVTDDVSMIYPGALIQGLGLSKDGEFLPVNIPRSGGRIFLRGLIFNKNAQYSRDIDEIKASTTNQAISEILTDNVVVGRTANFIFNTKQVYSYEQALLTLGIDARYGGGQMKNSLNIDSSKQKNYILATFTQIFYTVAYEKPVFAEGVFKDGGDFSDPDNVIRPGNPPLYISSVNYGRQVYFLIESTESEQTIRDTLDGAYKGFGAEVKINADQTYKDVMKKSKVSYWVRGGAADLPLQVIKEATPDKMYDSFKQFLANPDAANFSVTNPGLPVSYTVKYLMNERIVGMNMSAEYVKQDCYIAKTSNHKWEFRYGNMNYRMTVTRDGETIHNETSKTGGSKSGSSDFSVSDANDHTLSFVLSNGDCFSSHGDFYIYKDGIEAWRFNYQHGWSQCGEQMKVNFKFNNRAGGNLETQYCEVYRGAKFRTDTTCKNL